MSDGGPGLPYRTDGAAHGGVAYVDADWLSAAGEPTQSLVIGPDGDVWWASTPGLRANTPGAPEETVGVVLEALANDAIRAVTDIPPHQINVYGRGLAAAWVRDRLGIPPEPSRPVAASPRAIIDLTGSPDSLVRALQTVADLGRVVLAGPVQSSAVSLDFYPDVHVRCLQLVAVSPTLSNALSTASAERASQLSRSIEAAQTSVPPGGPFPHDGRLFRLSPSG